MTTIIVEGKLLGQKRPLFTDWHIRLPPIWERGGDRLKLRDLITRVVAEEVEAFRQRQMEPRLPKLLSRDEIESGARRGKVDPNGHPGRQELIPEDSVEIALQAYRDGLYYVFVDGVQAEGLDSEVYLKPNSRVTFIRLVPLAGG